MTLLLRNGNWPAASDFRLSDLFESDDLVVDKAKMIAPAINIFEDDNCYTVEIALPGMDREDFKVDLNGKVLTVSAIEAQDVEEEDEEENGGYIYQEYNYDTFRRSFSLPDDAIEDKIDACYEDGELIITIPKAAKTASGVREIEIG